MNYQRKYNKVWEKVTKSIKNEFDSETPYNEKYLKTEIKAYNEKTTQIFLIIKYQKKNLSVFAYQ